MRFYLAKLLFELNELINLSLQLGRIFIGAEGNDEVEDEGFQALLNARKLICFLGKFA